MAIIKRTTEVPYTAAQMFELVDRIEQYPQFLPWCNETTVHSRTEDEVKATIVVAKGGIQQAFSTINRLQPNKMIEVRLLKGPFRHLEGFWLFEAVDPDRCRVSFHLEFEFSNKLIALTVGPLLERVTDSFMEAFCKRAKLCYDFKDH